MQRLSPPGLRNAILKSLRGRGGQALATEMRIRAPHKSGGLIGGIDVHSGTAGSKGADDVLVGYQGGLSGGNRGGGRYQLGAWIESGTAPHEIVSRDGGSLKFNGGSFERVNHPGIRGRRIAAKSMKAAEWEVLADIVDVIDGMLVAGSGRG